MNLILTLHKRRSTIVFSRFLSASIPLHCMHVTLCIPSFMHTVEGAPALSIMAVFSLVLQSTSLSLLPRKAKEELPGWYAWLHQGRRASYSNRAGH